MMTFYLTKGRQTGRQTFVLVVCSPRMIRKHVHHLELHDGKSINLIFMLDVSYHLLRVV